MASIVRGTVAPCVKYFVTEAKGTSVLKFTVYVDGNENKKVPVVVFGKTAKDNQDIAEGQGIVVSGEYQDNEWQGEARKELKIFGGKGHIKLTGARVTKPDVAEEPPINLEGAPDLGDWVADHDEYEEWVAGHACQHCGLAELPYENDKPGEE